MQHIDRDRATPGGTGTTTFWKICLAIVVLAVIAHGAGINNDFIAGYDDDEYVLKNPDIRAGLSSGSLIYVLTGVCAANWHPLTMLSHLIDATFFGLWPAGHHAVNVLLHALNSALVFLALLGLTGARWRSAAVAALFAVHPIHVESVAFISQRKDLLCGLFFLLALRAYGVYARQLGAKNFAWVALWTVLALLSKPVAVTLPFVLLLLDFWPLGRLKDLRSVRVVVIEKIPLILLALLSSVVTFLVQRSSGAVAGLESHSPLDRIANVSVAYVAYLGKAILPVGLSPYYPMSNNLPLWQVAGSTLFLVLITFALLLLVRKAPFGIVGWLWFLGMLVPMIGLVQVGTQSMADRYAYITFIGLYVVFVWGVGVLVSRLPKSVVGGVWAILLLLLLTMSIAQTRYWKDSETLWQRALALDPANNKALMCLGLNRAREGQLDAALAFMEEANRILPSSSYLGNLGGVQFEMGRVDDAIATLTRSLELNPKNPKARFNLGIAYCSKRLPDDAEREFDQVDGKTAGFYVETAQVLNRFGYPQRALARLEKAKEIDPAYPNLDAAIAAVRAAISKAQSTPAN